MSKSIEDDSGNLVGFTGVPSVQRAKDLLDDSGIVWNVAFEHLHEEEFYSSLNGRRSRRMAPVGVNIYFNRDNVNVACYSPVTEQVSILERPDGFFGKVLIEIIEDRRNKEPDEAPVSRF
jgi:hypothetical protein